MVMKNHTLRYCCNTLPLVFSILFKKLHLKLKLKVMSMIPYQNDYKKYSVNGIGAMCFHIHTEVK